MKQNGNGKNKSIFSVIQKKRMLGILLIFFSLLLLLSIVSYNDNDKTSEFFKDIFASLSGSSDYKGVTNWLGIVGAHISSFFIKSTLGIFSTVIPLLLMLWGVALSFKINYKTLIKTSNFLLLFGLILSAFFGLLRTKPFNFFSAMIEPGSVGNYLGKVIGNLLGPIGGIIFLTGGFAALIIFTFNIKLDDIIDFIKNVFESNLTDKEEPADEKSLNLAKIKELNESRKKKVKREREPALTGVDLMDEESEEQTRIRIIRKDEPELQIKNAVHEEEIKKVDLQKVGEIPEPEYDKDDESALPNQWEENINYKKPSFDLLEPNPLEDFVVAEEELKRNAELLKEKLKLFDIEIQDISVTPGPVVTLYEIVPAPGVKISKIVGLENDIALALAARGIRIIAPIPGKSAIGVEIPNAEASLVNARSVLVKVPESKYELPMAFGKTISGDVYITDLAKMPHLLIAGSTGSGKSVGINMIISSLLYSKDPLEVKLAMIDPKKIELSFYKKLRKHFLAVCPDLDEEIITAPQNAVLLLKSIEMEMEKRYDKLAKTGVRNIVDYNKKISDPSRRPKDTDEMKHHPMPYIIVIVDELADLMITAGKDVEEPITRLAQLARAVGIHLVLATQRPSVNVITGVIKANFSARIAYQVATKVDSRTILDMNGAEQLLGKGDMLFLPTGSPKPIRIQNAFISTDEVEKITNFIYSQQGYSKPYYLPSIYEKKKGTSGGFLADLDPMFEDAARVIVRHQQGSVSLLQRRLKLGYSRAARIVDQLEEAGIVGPNDGSKARTVIVENEEQLETILRNL
ncbi:MAG: cell division protein FtsK [Ignavibacteria bacterium RBG_16_34_14]|nr:MAG: cell division protein FtsK [Ignavibacteria bacterium RBG_16_34_14]